MPGTARNGDLTIRYETRGAGRPLVLLHAYSLSSEAWQDMGYVEPLVEAGHRLVLIDLRGHGGSGKPHDPAAYAEPAQALDVRAVMDALGLDRASLMGYSRGGRMALEFAAEAPERVDRLAIGGAHPFVQDMSLFRAAMAEGIEGWIAVIERFGGPLPEPLRARIAANDVAALNAAVAEDRPGLLDRLGGFDRPCLFFSGTDDPLRPEIARAAGLLPRARFVEIAGCNHMTALQRADLVLPPLCAFLGGSAPPQAR